MLIHSSCSYTILEIYQMRVMYWRRTRVVHRILDLIILWSLFAYQNTLLWLPQMVVKQEHPWTSVHWVGACLSALWMEAGGSFPLPFPYFCWRPPNSPSSLFLTSSPSPSSNICWGDFGLQLGQREEPSPSPLMEVLLLGLIFGRIFLF